MSNKIAPYLDPILNAGGIDFYLKRGTIDFLEGAYNQQDATIIQTMIGASYSNSVVYILFGCVSTVGGGNTTISSGALFFNGEIYLTTGFATATTPANIVANLTETSWQPTDALGDTYADPQEFVGAGNSNIHIYRTVSLVSGASGTGTLSGDAASDFVNLIGYGKWNTGATLSITCSGGGSATVGTVVYNKYRIDGSTLKIAMQLTNITITGTVNTIIFTDSLMKFKNVGGTQYNSALNQITPLRIATQNGGIWIQQLSGSAFTPGSGQYVDINIEGEI